MKIVPLFTATTLLLCMSSCTSMGPIAKTDKYQMEITLHKTRADIEEIKHDLHTQKMEVNVIEGKLVNQEDSLASLKKEAFELYHSKLDQYAHQVVQLDKRMASLEKCYGEVEESQNKIVQSTAEMHKALSQNKDRINEMERLIALQSKSLNEIAKLRKSVDKASQMQGADKREFIVDTYRIKGGETLEEIAHTYGVSLDALLKINRLETDKIVAGQEIIVPSFRTN
jgi:LysM repeat protein